MDMYVDMYMFMLTGNFVRSTVFILGGTPFVIKTVLSLFVAGFDKAEGH